MKILKMLSCVALASVLAVGITACNKEGSAEHAGKKIDNAADDAQHKIKQAVNPDKGPAQRAGKKMDDTLNDND